MRGPEGGIYHLSASGKRVSGPAPKGDKKKEKKAPPDDAWGKRVADAKKGVSKEDQDWIREIAKKYSQKR